MESASEIRIDICMAKIDLLERLDECNKRQIASLRRQIDAQESIICLLKARIAILEDR